MRYLWSVISALYLSKIRGYYRLQRFLDNVTVQLIPASVYASTKKLNLGSSNRPIPNYINVDVLEERNPDIVCDVSRLDFASSDEFDLVRASHILEHFYAEEAPRILAEWRRVLKTGGYLVLCVPNWQAIAWRTILRPSEYDLEEATDKPRWINGIFALDLPPEFRHKVIFTKRSLSKLLTESGFQVVGVLNYRKEHPFALGIEDDSCNAFSLNLVAVKR